MKADVFYSPPPSDTLKNSNTWENLQKFPIKIVKICGKSQ